MITSPLSEFRIVLTLLGSILRPEGAGDSSNSMFLEIGVAPDEVQEQADESDGMAEADYGNIIDPHG